MRSMVVLFALAAVACGSYIPAQPPHHPAVVLDPHGRPLDTAEVINARALHLQAKALEGYHSYAPLAHAALTPYAHTYAAPALVAAPAAVSHQARVDVHSSPALYSVHAAPLLTHSALGHGHWLKKRSLGHLSYAHALAPAAVSHQSRVDVVSSPAVVSHAYSAPVLSHAYAAPAPIIAHTYAAPAAVSHQSRVDVSHNHALVAPVAPLAYSSYLHAPLAHHASPLYHGW